jgi:hypothetical protein
LAKADRDRAPDAAVAAGDQPDFAFELAGGAILAHLGARLGVHRRLPAGLPVLLLGRVVRGLRVRHGAYLSLSLDRRTTAGERRSFMAGA